MKVSDLMEKINALWPTALNTPEKLTAWSDIYREQLGFLTPERLSEAWRRTMASHTGMRPPLPADILANIPDARAPLLAAVGGVKTMKGMCESLPETISELLADFWRNFGTWFDQQLDERGIEEERRGHVRWAYNQALYRVAHFQAQGIYWRGGDRVLDLRISNGYYVTWLDAAWGYGKKEERQRHALAPSRLGNLAAGLVQKAIERPA